MTRSPAILLIVREPLKPGSRAAYAEIEDEIARDSAALGCPHPHVALEPLGEPEEVWWLNAFVSDADRQRVERAYVENRPLMAALERNGARKRAVTGATTEAVARFRPDLSRGPAWSLKQARFLVVEVTREDAMAGGSVFEASDGDRYVMQPAATRELAEAEARAWGRGARVLAVQPRWGFPARDWIEADPGFWQSNPVASRPPGIEIVAYDPSWPAAFAAEARRLGEALGPQARRIDHNGSTSVPGLAAKPIIDIQISVNHLEPLAAYGGPLERIGYVHVPHADDAFCPFFHQPAGWPHTHHVHVVQAGGDEERRTLAFRDYLRAHDDEARHYERLKRDLAIRLTGADADAREAYARAKSEFIERIVTLALKQGYPQER